MRNSDYVTVRLTTKEAEEACIAIGYATMHPNSLDPFGDRGGEIVDDARGLNAALRAERKIQAALRDI